MVPLAPEKPTVELLGMAAAVAGPGVEMADAVVPRRLDRAQEIPVVLARRQEWDEPRSADAHRQLFLGTRSDRDRHQRGMNVSERIA